MNNEQLKNKLNKIIYNLECIEIESTSPTSVEHLRQSSEHLKDLLSDLSNETLELSELKQEKEFLMQTITTINKLTNAR